jgi:putative Mn2+ efflux pump MntP
MKNMNSFQVIALVGLIFTIVAQGILWVVGKAVDHYMYLYPTWVAVFVLGLILNPYFSKHDEDHHH